MLALAGFMMLLGITGAAVALVMLIIRLFFKRGWVKKRILTVGAISVVLFAVGLAMGWPSAQEGYEGQTARVKDSIVHSSSPSSPSSSIEPVTANEEPNDNKSTVEEQNSDRADLIPGILAADIKVNLEQSWKLKFTGPRSVPNSKEYLDDGKVTDPDTGVELSCTITEDIATKVKYATFRVDGTGVAGLLPAERFLAVSKGFLGYCSTLPYDGSDPDKAKEWIEKNIGNANQPGKSITTTIGNVEFKLAGGKYIRLLSMRPAGVSE